MAAWVCLAREAQPGASAADRRAAIVRSAGPPRLADGPGDVQDLLCIGACQPGAGDDHAGRLQRPGLHGNREQWRPGSAARLHGWFSTWWRGWGLMARCTCSTASVQEQAMRVAGTIGKAPAKSDDGRKRTPPLTSW